MNVEYFRQALTFVAKWEWAGRPDGGYTNDPKDPGGETKYGISKRNHSTEDIANLTADRALAIYTSDYWVPIGGDNLPLPCCVVAFDSAVNCGVGRVLFWLRTSKDDWQVLIDLRKAYYIDIVKNHPVLQKFLTGWLARLADLQKYCEGVVASTDS